MKDWENLDTSLNTSSLVQIFQDDLNRILIDTFPEKKVIINPNDEPWFNEKLRLMKRQRQRIYLKQGKSEKYLECQEKFSNQAKIDVQKYKDKIIQEVKEGKRGSSYAGLRKLGMRPGEFKQTGFQLPDYGEDNLSNLECAEKIAEYFSKVSQEYPPLDIRSLPPNVKQYLGNPEGNSAPMLSSYDV